MNNDHDQQLVSQYESIKSILKSLEKDFEQESQEYETFNKVLRNYYVHELKYKDTDKAKYTALKFIENNKNTLKKIQSIEKRENRLFSTTSNVALLTTIGAAVSASLAPALVVPAAAIAAVTALGGYIGKLKLDNDAKDEAKYLIQKMGLEALNEEGLANQVSGRTKSRTP
ncbi:hypothetical protein [Shewanella acanthi]|uniref:hypothetical protein n=1 Tax=Shewanella acanthi TaxID=2864212 RepID=UPI001C65E682|nr:hypothetical protein [Shewanella acanthi]QYJ77343.1 hypothetical protein K0H61_09210 [Shewanella acanthi]